jgi:hypothetical protein
MELRPDQLVFCAEARASTRHAARDAIDAGCHTSAESLTPRGKALLSHKHDPVYGADDWPVASRQCPLDLHVCPFRFCASA